MPIPNEPNTERKDTDMITLSVASQLSGVPLSTLKYAAKVGNLTAEKKKMPTGMEYYLTTLKDVERWKGTYTPHIKKS